MRFVTRGVRNNGPTPLFIVGNLPLVLFFGTKLEVFIAHLRKKYGKMFEFWMGWQRGAVNYFYYYCTVTNIIFIQSCLLANQG